MVSLRRYCRCSLAWMGVFFFFACGAAEATLMFAGTSSITGPDPTQLGRLSRNGVPQDWTGSEPFPGVIDATIAYHYTTLNLDLTALEAPYAAYGGFIQISFDSLAATTFLSAYLDAYDPLNLATNWLGDPGRSGNFFGVDPLFFQVVVPAGHHLILVLNETATNGGLDLPGDILVEAFADTDFTDLTPRPTAPEPGTLDLLVGGLAVLLAARRFGGARRLVAMARYAN